MELKTCNILGLDILVTDMEKTVNLIEQNIEQLRGKYICVGNVQLSLTDRIARDMMKKTRKGGEQAEWAGTGKICGTDD